MGDKKFRCGHEAGPRCGICVDALFESRERRVQNLEQAVDHAKDEYYHRGRRDLAFELAGDWNEAVDADEFGEHLETVRQREVDAYKRHPRSRKAGAH